MWELVEVSAGRHDLVETRLKEGYEPFAVSTNSYNFVTIWMRRKVEDEVYSKPKPIKGTSRRTAKTIKG